MAVPPLHLFTFSPRCFVIQAAALLCAAAISAHAQSPARLPSLQHVVKHFDFEEPDAAPNSLPVPFYRYIAASAGFPPFGSMRLTNACAFAGSGSLEFELGGGSMSARIPTAVIPILPFTDYTVTARVRTDGLVHSGARIGAWLHDKTGQVIADSRVYSRLANTSGEWETLTVEVRGLEADAADLVIDLQVVQPTAFAASGLDKPRLEDIAGRVWFDEIVVSHLPRVHLSLVQSRNLVHWPDVPQVRVYVNEATTESLTARLQVFDVDGRLQYDSTFPAPRGASSGAVRLPLDRCGWYRALLHITSSGGVSRQRWLDFTIVAPPPRQAILDRTWGVVLPETPDDAHVPAQLRELRCGSAVTPIWGTRNLNAEQQASLNRQLQALLRDDVQLVFALNSLPEQLARNAGVEPSQVLAALAMDQKLWQPFLNDMLVNFGLEVNRWQIGSTVEPDAFWREDVGAMMHAAKRSMTGFVPRATLYAAWSIEQSVHTPTGEGGFAIAVPHHVSPSAIEQYAAAFRESGADFFLNLESLPEELAAARPRVIDLALRALHAWRAGVPQINIPAPWHDAGASDLRATDVNHPSDMMNALEREHLRQRAASIEPMPDPFFGMWRTLAIHLSGRRFIGEAVVGENLHCWMIRGSTIGDSALIMWSDARTPATVQMQLAAGDVMIHDLYGNQSISSPIDGLHTIKVGESPIFVERVNVSLVQFRGSVRIEPEFIPAVNKVHEHQIVIHNPWEMPISGSIRLHEGDQWQLLPTVQSFTIQAGGEARVPLTIIPQRNIIAGAKAIPCTVTLNADQAYSIDMDLELRTGLQNIDLKASWTADPNPQTGVNDLVVTQVVTNHGEKAVNLDMYVLGDDIGLMRRTIAGLGAGQTVVRTFRIPNGVSILAGKQIRVGVSERDSSVRLNRLLTIGPQKQNEIASAPDSSGQ